MTLTSWLVVAPREFKGSAGRLLFFAACLSVGVAAVVAVAGISRALDDGIQEQAKQLLAADLAISSRRPIPDDMVAAVEEAGFFGSLWDSMELWIDGFFEDDEDELEPE